MDYLSEIKVDSSISRDPMITENQQIVKKKECTSCEKKAVIAGHNVMQNKQQGDEKPDD